MNPNMGPKIPTVWMPAGEWRNRERKVMYSSTVTLDYTGYAHRKATKHQERDTKGDSKRRWEIMQLGPEAA